MASTDRRPSLPDSNGSTSLLQKAKRTLSVRRPRTASLSLKGILGSNSSASSSPHTSGTTTPIPSSRDANARVQKPYSIAPTSHREVRRYSCPSPISSHIERADRPTSEQNTALHALLDSLPTLPTFHAPSLPNVSLPSLPSFSSPFGSSSPRNLTDDEDDNAPAPPPSSLDLLSDPLKRCALLPLSPFPSPTPS